MIRKLKNTMFVALTALLSVAAVWAQNDPAGGPPPSAAAKIGFVDFGEVLYGTEEGKTQIAKIQRFVDGKQRQYESQRGELDKLREQFGTQQLTANAQAQAGMQRRIEQSERRLRRLEEDTRLAVDQRRNELLGKIGERVQAIIDQYASNSNFDAIFLRSETQVYVDPSLDYTQDIIQIYNEKHGGSSAAATPAQP